VILCVEAVQLRLVADADTGPDHVDVRPVCAAALASACSTQTMIRMDPLPDPRSLATEELKSVLKQRISREQEVSNARKVLHAEIDALRQELVRRLREEGNDVILGPDILGPGWAGVREPRRPGPQRGSDGVALPEPSDSDSDPSTP
jgi:hypothetical protein